MVSSRHVRLALLVIVLLAVAIVLLVAGVPSGHDLRHAVRRAGWLAPGVFVAIYIAWTVMLLPGVVPTLAGGALFGVLAGSLLTLTGAIAGATLAFAIARHVGRAPFKQLAGMRAERLERWLARHGFVALVYARLVPVVPFNVLNYAAGVAGMPTRSYVVATALGVVPGTVAYTILGSTATHPGSVPFVVSVVAVAALTVVVGVVSRRPHPLAER